MKKITTLWLVLLTCCGLFAQKKLTIDLDKIPVSYKKDVNKVILQRQEVNEIKSQTILKQSYSETNLILNKDGLDELDISIIYDKLSKINDVEFKIYNTKGELIKTYKRKDFSDASLADGFSILTDDRILYHNPTHFEFPVITKFDFETEQANTISIPPFAPIQSPDDRVVEAFYSLKYPAGLLIKKDEKKLQEYNVIATHNDNTLTYSVSNIVAPEYEDLNVHYENLLPVVRFSNSVFSLGNVKGKANDWNEFGVWYYENFLKGLDQLPQETISKMQNLTKDAKDDVAKAKIIFEYMQNNTRYISVQVGLGGWRPFAAKEVDKFGYGDCKALTNYTKSLLDCVGVKSYYTIIHASERIRDFNENVLSLQGNHVILTLPTPDGNIFLECTSQKIPFGYLGSSTDNRKALAVKSDGAFIVSTHSNNEKDNQLNGRFLVNLSKPEKVKTNIVFENKGSFYNSTFRINTNDNKQVTKYIKNVFSSLKDLVIVDYKFEHDKEGYIFNENINIESAFIGAKMGNDFMISVNPFFSLTSLPKKYDNRKTGFSITRGKSYNLSTEYILPIDLITSFVPQDKKIESKFGKHILSIQKTKDRIIVNEHFTLKKSDYAKEDYESYEKFLRDVFQSTNSKIILTKK